MKILTKTQGSTTENTLRKIFKKYDLNNDGILRLSEFRAILIDLGLEIEKKHLIAVMN